MKISLLTHIHCIVISGRAEWYKIIIRLRATPTSIPYSKPKNKHVNMVPMKGTMSTSEKKTDKVNI